jgi:hypothetical protein
LLVGGPRWAKDADSIPRLQAGRLDYGRWLGHPWLTDNGDSSGGYTKSRKQISTTHTGYV